MFWYKAWLETKFKFLLALGFMIFYLIVFYLMRNLPPPPGGRTAALAFGLTATIFAVILDTWLAGAGIDTQPGLRATKGLHGSTLFTLSLPVSRFRLLTVRAGIGWLEMAVAILAWCCGLLFILPAGRSVPAVDMLEYVITLIVCASSVYFLSVLLGTFLDDQWRMHTTAMASAMLWMLCTFARLPESVNILQAIVGESSPLVSHTLPWMAMLFSLALAAVFFLAAVKIAQLREY